MGTGAHHDRSVGQREISLVRREPPFQTGLRRERARCAQQAHCGPSPRELCRGRGLSESLRDATPMLTRQRPNLFLRQPHPQTRPHDPHTRRRPRAYERLAPPAPPNACCSAPTHALTRRHPRRRQRSRPIRRRGVDASDRDGGSRALASATHRSRVGTGLLRVCPTKAPAPESPVR